MDHSPKTKVAVMLKHALNGLISVIAPALFIIVVSFNQVEAAEEKNFALNYTIPVVEGAFRFVDILEYPGYGAIAMQNNSIILTSDYEVKIKDRQTFEIKGTEFKFVKKEGNLFFYQVKLVGFMRNVVPVVDLVIDTSSIRNGVINLGISSSIIGRLPVSVKNRIKQTVERLTNKNHQRKIIEYFQKLTSAYGNSHNRIQGILDGIMVDAYNMHLNEDGMIYKAEVREMDYFVVFIYIAIIFSLLLIIYLHAMKSRV